MRRSEAGRVSGGIVVLLLLCAGGVLAYTQRERLPFAALASTLGNETQAALPEVALAPPARSDDRVAALGRLEPKDGVRRSRARRRRWRRAASCSWTRATA